MLTKDVYFKYARQTFGSFRTVEKFLVDSFCFDGEPMEFHHSNFKPKEVVGNQFIKLFCRCGACDFNDNGRWMHEYQCNCCGKYITVYRRNEHGQDPES